MSGLTRSARPGRRRLSSPLWAAAAAVLCLVAASPAAGAWTPPVEGEVVRRFDFSRATPYAGGRHRGVDLAARTGQTVVAPCAGRVTFAGRVPAHGRGVTIACGAHAATVLELASTRVARGTHAARGMPIGVAGARPVHLGARRRGHRHGYVDPLGLLARTPAPTPAVPLGRAPQPAAPGRPAPAPLPVPASTPRPTAAPAPQATPVLAWLGLALLVCAIPSGALAHRRRRSTVADRAETAV